MRLIPVIVDKRPGESIGTLFHFDLVLKSPDRGNPRGPISPGRIAPGLITWVVGHNAEVQWVDFIFCRLPQKMKSTH